MSYPVLKRAPIVEALLDVRIAPELPDISNLTLLDQALAAEFPTRAEIKEWTGKIDLTNKPEVPSVKLMGIMRSAEDQRRVVQLRTNGFSFSHLKPYQDWATLSAEARPLWDRYVSAVPPDAAVRLGLRYINRLELPPGADAKRFLRVTVEVPPDLPQSLTSFFMRFSLSFGEVTALITQMVDPAQVTAENVPFLLDIDVFRTVSLHPTADALWDCFEELRNVKNDVFFKSLTPTALEMFE